jgi:signal transduction histidine kinase/DNA-binding response OmpR family regulator/ligand-binding sensor domain-containing protein
MKFFNLCKPTIVRHLLLLVLNIVSISATAQYAYENTTPKFQQLGLRDGLSNLNITSIVQDDLGNMWFATARGVNRFDGNLFKHYLFSDNDSSQLSIMGPTTHKNDKGQLFFESALGVNIFDTQEDKMYHLESKHGLFYSFVDFDHQTYAVSSRSGISIYRPSQKNFEKLPHIKNDLLLSQLIADSLSGIWGKSLDKTSLSNYNPRTNTFKQFFIPSVDGVFPNGPIVIIDSLLIINGQYSSVFNLRTEKFSPLPDIWSKLQQLGDSELFFAEQINEALYFGTRRRGLFIFDPKNNTLDNLNKSNSAINSNFIRSIYKDRDENIWLGSFDHGINLVSMNLGSVNYDNSLNKLTDNKFVNSITSDALDNYYISTRNYGFFVYNARNKTSQVFNTENSYLSSNYVVTIFIDSKNKLWVSDAKVLHISSLNSRQSKDIILSDLGEGVCHLCEHDSKIIACSDRGLFIFDLEGKLIKQETRLGTNISQVIPLNKEEVIVASYYEGVFIYNLNSGEFRNIYKMSKDNNEIPNQTITIYLEDKYTLWIGNYGTGLHRLDLATKDLSIFTMEDGLPNNDVVGIQEDSLGNLWLSTSYGLSRFDKDKTFVNYYYTEGLNNLQFHAKSAYTDKNGIIYFSGNRGLSYFDPMLLSKSINKKAPRIILETLTIQNELIKPGDESGVLSTVLNSTSELTLKHNQNSITIEYHAFDYLAADAIRYEYMLEGLDEVWVKAGKRNVANFSNLNPGHYSFKVKAKNDKGTWSETLSLDINIKPSPFKTVWAFLIYSSLLIAIIYITFQLRLRAKLYKNELELEHKERTRESEVAQMKMRFFTNISHEIRTPLTLIKGNVDLLSEELAERRVETSSFTGLQYSTNRLLSLVNQLLSVRKLENEALDLRVKKDDIIQLTNKLIQPFVYLATSRKITISVETDIDELTLPIDEDKYEKIMCNLLSNSIKHVDEEGHIKIRIENLEVSEVNRFFEKSSGVASDAFVKISGVDNGVGIPQEEIALIFDRFLQSTTDSKKPDYSGTGIGLDFTKKLVELHHGAMTVSSEKNVETAFSFVLPLDDKTYKEDSWIREDKNLEAELIESPVESESEDRADSEKELVLLVEDDLELNRFIRSSLKKHFRVISAYNGKEGVNMAKDQLPHLIISDIMMPEMDGYGLCKQIRNDELISHIPIVLLTAKTDAESKVRGYEYGADDYVSKPFEQSVLIARINNLIDSRKKLQSSYKQGIVEEHQMEGSNQYELNFVKRIESIVATEYQSPKLNVNFLAEHMNMSRTNFYRKFMSVMDISPKDFITKYRINKSIEMIKNGNDNLGEISYLCGFGSQSNFSAIFKKEKEMTPLQFKKASL